MISVSSGTLEGRNRSQICPARLHWRKKIAPRAALRVLRSLNLARPRAMAMTSGTMGLTSRNYDHDIAELWDQHCETLPMTSRN